MMVEKKKNKSSKEELEKEKGKLEEEKEKEKGKPEEEKEKEKGKPEEKKEKEKGKLEEEKEKKKGKPEKEKEKERGKPEYEFRNVTPKTEEEGIERYIENIPEVFVDKYVKYLNTHKEDDELTRRYPNDFDRSVRVLPMEKEGTRSLRMVSTDKKKTEDFRKFLKDGKFHFEDEAIDGVEGERERIVGIVRRRIRERLRP